MSMVGGKFCLDSIRSYELCIVGNNGYEGDFVNEEEVVLTKEGAIARILINREKALNALNQGVMMRLDQIFSELEADVGVLVAIITGAGQKAFVAGADIAEIGEAGDNRTELIRKGQAVFSRIRNSSKVVIAAINGYALGGGCELALACDFRIASESTKLGFPETKLGLMPGYGGTQILPRLVGMAKAKWMIYSGEMITASEAYRIGLVEMICNNESLQEEASRLAMKIASNGPFAVKTCKRAIQKGLDLPLEKALQVELEEYDRVARSSDAEEGMAAFLSKRKPNFKGK